MARGLFDEVDSAWYVLGILARMLVMLAIVALKTVWHHAVGQFWVARHPDADLDFGAGGTFLAGKTCLLTGATRGIGGAVVRRIVALPPGERPKRMILLVREPSLPGAAEMIASVEAAGIEVRCHAVDLLHLDQVCRVARRISVEEAELHLLVSVAGIWSTERGGRAVVGAAPGIGDLEVHFVVNYLSTALLVRALRPLMEKSVAAVQAAAAAAHAAAAPARVILTGSFTAYDIAGGVARLGDLQLEKRRGSVHFGVASLVVPQAMAYAHSKLLLHMYAKHLGGSAAGPEQIRVVLVDPGIVHTDLHAGIKNCLWPWLADRIYRLAGLAKCLRSPEEGAAPLIHCCLRRGLPHAGCGALFCDWGKTYRSEREPEADLAHFAGSDILSGGRWRAVAPSLADDAQCRAVYEETEALCRRLEATYAPGGGAADSKVSAVAPTLSTPSHVTAGGGGCGHGCLPDYLRGRPLLASFYVDLMLPLSEFLPASPPGPPLIPFRYIVNLQKGGTFFFCFLLMSWSGNFSQTAWTYTAMHGSYGVCWLLKDAYFRDPKTNDLGSLVGLLVVAAILSTYWYLPLVVIVSNVQVPPAQGACCVVLCITGTVLMMVADCHKYFALEYNRERASRKRYLITDGVFSANRNPNYLGEMLVYGSFVLMTGPRLEAAVAIGGIWLAVFGTNMVKKDLSLAEKPGWEAYKKQSHLFLFKWALPVAVPGLPGLSRKRD